MLKNFSYLIEGELAGSAYPGGWASLAEDLEEVIMKGIKAIVTLTEEPLPHHYLKEYDIEYLHLPIRDFYPPEIQQIFKFVEFVEEHRKVKKPVLVHCWAGMGRTGTLLAAYLVYRGYTADKAVKHVRRLRFGSIETKEQFDKIYEFEQVVRKNAEG